MSLDKQQASQRLVNQLQRLKGALVSAEQPHQRRQVSVPVNKLQLHQLEVLALASLLQHLLPEVLDLHLVVVLILLSQQLPVPLKVLVSVSQLPLLRQHRLVEPSVMFSLPRLQLRRPFQHLFMLVSQK